jgi:hypothetical protein
LLGLTRKTDALALTRNFCVLAGAAGVSRYAGDGKAAFYCGIMRYGINFYPRRSHHRIESIQSLWDFSRAGHLEQLQF